MWKRMNRPYEKSIDTPPLIITPLDTTDSGTLGKLTTGELSISSRPGFGRKQTQDVVRDLHGISFNSAQAIGPSDPRFSAASSHYSQPSPKMRQNHPRIIIPDSSSSYPDDVSPPDSPRTLEGQPSRISSSPNISPITDAGSIFRGDSKHQFHASSIPVPKLSSTGGTAAFIAGWRDKIGREVAQSEDPKTTRWDDYSGEPSARGKRASAVPGFDPFDVKNDKPGKIADQATPSPKANTVRQQRQTLWASKLKKVGRSDAAALQPVREEWKGASGRIATVKPMVDKPLPPGVTGTFSSSNQRKLSEGPTKQLIEDKVPAQEPAYRNTSPDTVLPKKASGTVGIRGIRPVAPSNTGIRSPESPGVRGPSASGLNNSTNLPTDLDRRSPLGRTSSGDTSPEETPSKPSTPRAYISEQMIPDDLEYHIRAAARDLHLDTEPASRFSATTYNTTVPDSPPDTPTGSIEEPPPMPKMTLSILNRKRPVPASGVPVGKGPTRKPTPGETQPGNSKALPQSPPEPQIVDRVTMLEAKLTALSRRQGNLQTVIHELTHVVQPSSMAYDMASRQEIKKTVEGLNTESAAVAKEIHETGMKLHRALKRRDEQSMFEPTGLWVRRVTE